MSKYVHVGYIVAISVLLIGLAIAMVSWKQASVDHAIAATKSEANQKTIDQNQSEIQRRKAEQDERDKRFDDQISQLRTMVQARQALQPIIMQQPIPTQQVTRAELPAAVQQQLPDAPLSTKYSLLSDDQVIAIAKNKLACDKVSADLQTCSQDKTTLQSSLKTAQSDAETWKKEAKGGGTWLRFKRAGKWFLIGAGAGASVYAATHH
jgi:hypothetical protein